jgi:hypothetical protein
MDLATGKAIAWREPFFRLALKMKAAREVPEGLCMRCAGTGNGEEVADLGEALYHGRDFPINECASCGGSGMAMAKVEVTALGLLLGCSVVLAIWASSWPLRLILLSVLSIAALDAIRRRKKHIQSDAVKQRMEIASVPDVVGPPTDQLVSLIDAFGNDRQMADQEKPAVTVVNQTSVQPH